MKTLTFTPIINDETIETACNEIFCETGMIPLVFAHVLKNEDINFKTYKMGIAARDLWQIFPEIKTLLAIEVVTDHALSNVIFFEYENLIKSAEYNLPNNYKVAFFDKRDNFLEKQ